MENTNNSDQQRVDQVTGGPLEGMSPQANLDQDMIPPGDDSSDRDAVYADLGLDGGGPDVMNPGEEEASDTILYTDNTTARHAMDNVSNDVDYDSLPENEALRDEEIDRLGDEGASNTDETDRYLAY